jgi:dynein heavy chain
MELQPRSSSSTAAGASPQTRVESALESIRERCKDVMFNLDDIAASVVDDRGPFQNVFLLECDRMNQLVGEILRSLDELDLGLSGELQMSTQMETYVVRLMLL